MTLFPPTANPTKPSAKRSHSRPPSGNAELQLAPLSFPPNRHAELELGVPNLVPARPPRLTPNQTS